MLELLSELRQLGIQLSTDGGKLRCQAPNNALTPRLRAALAERKAEIIEFLKEGDRGLAQAARSIPTRSHHQNLPLSFAQQRLWFLDRIEPNSSAYNISEAFELAGGLDRQVLQRSLDLLVAHHEILRTNYLMADGEPIQSIQSARSIDLKIVDLQHYSTAEQPHQIQIQLARSSHQPFNLTTDLMLRCCLLQLSPTRQILVATMHHIASDAWSMGLFWQQLGQVYTAIATNQPNPLVPLQIQYADYAIWQREWLSCEVLTAQIEYWKQQLLDVNPVLEVPTDYPRPAIQTYAGAIDSIELSPRLTADLQALCRQEGTTLFMTLLAAFQLLMSRHSGQSDFIIAAPIAGRNQTEVEQLIGFFINTLLLDADLAGNPSFQTLLGRVRKVALGAYSHQDVPFEKLIEELNPRRDLSRNPLFQVLFNMLNVEQINLNLAGLTASPVNTPTANSKFDITLYVKEHDRQIQLDLAYNTDLFTPARMIEILHQFEYLLTQIVAAPERQVQSYSLVTPTAQAILPDPRIALSQPQYPPITTTFLDWAKRTPSQPAIIQAAHTWTYQELATAAQNIAQLLHSHQIKIGDPVAVSGDRSFGSIASMLGVLLSGGVLLNIDPQLPVARQQLIQSTAAAKYLLAIGNTPQIANLSADIQVFQISPDTGNPSTATGSTQLASDLNILPFDAAAYIFFTSGTTGTPKGVLGTHQGLAHFLDWQRETFAVSPQDRVAQLTGLSFDVVLRDIFLPLTSGATLCLPGDTEDLSPGRILPWLERQQITLLHTVPTLAQSWLLNVPNGVSLRTLRQIFFAGEPLTATLIQRWRETFPLAGEIVNLYGPTETTLAKCYYRVPDRVLAGIQPVGQPLPATQALVVKLDRQLCGIGEAGEIAIRTPFRTKGYLDAAATNQSRFIKNPDRADLDDLIYYTGDRGRYRPDGTLEILGRIDRQIKIRGIRIEPTEISGLLDKHPQIQTSIVVAREDIPGDKRLVAYCVAQPNAAPTSRELRQLLKQQLPDYLVPSAFVILTALPLTPNGKIDTQALPPPTESRADSGSKFVAARDEVEVALTKIWQQVLGVRSSSRVALPTIGITDNFFELGGHSLLAIRLFAEIERVWGKSFPLATLFQAQTIEQLANLLRQEEWTAPSSSLVKIQSGSTKSPLFCIHPIGGNVLEYYRLAYYLGQEQSVYGLQSLGLDGKEVPLRSIEAMASHYISEMQIVQPHGPYLLVGYSFAGLVVYEIAQQLTLQGEKVALLALLDRISPTFTPFSPSLIESFKIHSYNLWLLNLPGKWKYIINRIKYRYIHKKNFRNHVIAQWDNSLSPDYIEVFDANLQASEDYRATAYAGNLTLFRCQIQPQNQAPSPDLSWRDLVTGSIEIYPVAATHYEMLLEPHVQSLAAQLKFCIDKSLQNSCLPVD